MQIAGFSGFEPWHITLIMLTSLVGAITICLLILKLKHMRKRLLHNLNAHEITKDKLFQAIENLDLYREWIEEQGNMVIKRDFNDRILQANACFLTFVANLNDPPQKIIGECFEFEGDIDNLIHAENGRILKYEQRIETSQGSRWIGFTEAPIRDEVTGQTCYQVIGRDITERRNAETASEAKSRFLATVSHEIRTPLNGVLGMAQLLTQTKISAEQTTYIEAIRTSGEALLSLIEQILDFSRIEAGRLEVHHEAFDLHSLCESVVELLAPKAQGKGIEIALNIENNVPNIVTGDAGRLRQILTNLCGNAVKFTEIGGVGITVQRDLDEHILFKIEDSGIGIPADRLPLIFEEFEQGDGSHTRKFEGTGLGLAISRKIIERLSGTLDVSSVVGHGSIFILRLALPVAPSAELTQTPRLIFSDVKMAPIKSIYHNLKGLKALIVGKTPFEPQFIAKQLKELGVTTILRATPEQALTDIAPSNAGVPDILIVDAALGDASRALANLARAAGIQTRIILLSPFERQSFGSPLEAGFNAWLTKPVRARSLMERVLKDRWQNTSIVQPPSLASKHPTMNKNLKGYEILVAEDNEINALIAERQLTAAEAKVTMVNDGLKATSIYTARLESHAKYHLPFFDFVLLDMRMPSLDGLSTLKRMKQISTDYNIPPPRFIALTANAFAQDKKVCLDSGFDHFMTKPLNLEQLMAMLLKETSKLEQDAILKPTLAQNKTIKRLKKR